MPAKSIHIFDLSKSYRIGHNREKTFRNSIHLGILSNFHSQKTFETFWALKDLSLEIEEGQVLGIIGRNGAGKTTLLKLLSRITYPTRGRFEIHGRVASLLEVGTGFHPELSGRENIFLNGTILGMSRSEVRKRFDEIVDFSGVENFLDTPVKRYSSGMFVRLAFSVAAHLEPDVLIVDEVLAVGDASFQRKCLGKMDEVASVGRTVLFVSHNMGAINQLCKRAIWIDDGVLKRDGPTHDVVYEYLSHENVKERKPSQRRGNKKVVFDKIELLDRDGNVTETFGMGDDMKLRLILQFNENLPEIVLGLSIVDSAGTRITHILNLDEKFEISGNAGDKKEIEILFPRVFLSPGLYYISVGLEKMAEIFDDYMNILEFNVFQSTKIGRSSAYPRNVNVYMPSNWKEV